MATTINNITVPLIGYEPGKTWSGSYDGDYQGKGFAKLVLDHIWGLNKTTYKKGDFHDIKGKLKSLFPGSMVTVHWKPGKIKGWQYHSFIVEKKSSSGITVYDCNFSDTDEIDERFWKWTDFTNRFDYITSVQVPDTTA